MTPIKLSKTHRQERGLTLVELLIALAITGLIGGAVTTALIHTDTIVVRDRNQLVSTNQVHNAGHWIQTDVKMAQVVNPGSDAGFPLTLSWVDWENNEFEVIYYLNDNSLQRSYSVNSSTPSVHVVADSVVPGSPSTRCYERVYDDDSVTLVFELTVMEGQGPHSSTDSRVFEVKPRPS